MGSHLDPDALLYGQGGFGWYPSPIGRLIGSFGMTNGLWLTQSIAGAMLGFLLVRYVQSAGGSPIVALSTLHLSPAGWYLQPISVDVLASTMATCGVVYGRRCRVASATIVSLLHPASLVAFGSVTWIALRRAGWIRLLATALGAIALFLPWALLTPYGGVLTGWADVAFLWALPTFALGFGPIWIVRRYVRMSRGLYRASLISAVLGAAQAGAQGHMQVRYMLPALLLGCFAIRRRRPEMESV